MVRLGAAGGAGRASGESHRPMDGLFMATVQCHGLTAVTRNVADFARYPQVFNPWELA